MNTGITAAFLCIHHFQYLHTVGIYPNDQQSTWVATTSNDELGCEENSTAPPFVEEGYWGVQDHLSHMSQVGPLLMHCLGHVNDNLLVP